MKEDHDKMVELLFKEKSLEALLYLLERGRELEFIYEGQEWFLSRHGSRETVSLWEGTKEQAFSSLEELMKGARLGKKSFLEGWQDAERKTLF